MMVRYPVSYALIVTPSLEVIGLLSYCLTKQGTEDIAQEENLYLMVQEDIKEEELTMGSDEEKQFTEIDPFLVTENEDPLGLINKDIQLQGELTDQQHTPLHDNRK